MKIDLMNQVKALEAYCNQHALTVDEWMSDIGSGLNYQRKQFNKKVLKDAALQKDQA